MSGFVYAQDMAQNNPAFTAGGRREAEIATPTSDPTFPPSTDKATPAPDGRAIAIPVTKDLPFPLLVISAVGHLSIDVS